MKTIFLMLSVAFIMNANAQIREDKNTFATAQFNAGYDLKSSKPVSGFGFGLRTGNVYTAINTFIPLSNDATAPKIFTGSVGIDIGQFEPFLSYSYQTIGGVSERLFHGTPDEFNNGFKAGAGISYFFYNFPLQITVQCTGKNIISSLSLYKSL